VGLRSGPLRLEMDQGVGWGIGRASGFYSITKIIICSGSISSQFPEGKNTTEQNLCFRNYESPTRFLLALGRLMIKDLSKDLMKLVKGKFAVTVVVNSLDNFV
jgi:hypothetical protein